MDTSMTYGIALIGCGDMGRLHAEALLNLPDAAPVFFCDVDRERAKTLQSRFKTGKSSTDPVAAATDPNVHGIILASTTDSHLDVFRRIASSGKPVLIEKPLTLTVEAALEMDRIAEQADLPVMVAFKFRFYSLLQKAREWIGTPTQVLVQILDTPWPSDFWASDPAIGGGHIRSQGVHGADLLRYLIQSEPTSVAAVGRSTRSRFHLIDQLSALFRFENGSTGTLILGNSGQPDYISKFYVQLEGERGMVLLTDRLTHLHLYPLAGEPDEDTGSEDGIFRENLEFIQSIRHRSVRSSHLADGITAQQMIERALDACHSAHTEPIPTVGAKKQA